jgi:uncharacterized membrane protein YgcG
MTLHDFFLLLVAIWAVAVFICYLTWGGVLKNIAITNEIEKNNPPKELLLATKKLDVELDQKLKVVNARLLLAKSKSDIELNSNNLNLEKDLAEAVVENSNLTKQESTIREEFNLFTKNLTEDEKEKVYDYIQSNQQIFEYYRQSSGPSYFEMYLFYEVFLKPDRSNNYGSYGASIVQSRSDDSDSSSSSSLSWGSSSSSSSSWGGGSDSGGSFGGGDSGGSSGSW